MQVQQQLLVVTVGRKSGRDRVDGCRAGTGRSSGKLGLMGGERLGYSGEETLGDWECRAGGRIT